MTNREELLKDTDLVESLTFQALETKYIKVVLTNIIITYVILAILPHIIWIFYKQDISMILVVAAEILIIAACILNLIITKKACRFKGYAIREHDITYRRGIIFPKTTTVPFCKIQQVSIKQNPISRIFGLYAVEITNGAQMESSLTIPGLKQDSAESIKQLITEKIHNAE